MSEIRDPVHGFIEPSEKELKIINSKPLQRLRKIKQLAMEYLVYPSANHTRFEHTLGVFHIAGKIADKLLTGNENREKREIIRLAALLHDIGHGPFSHTSEDILEKYSTLPAGAQTNKIHELITTDIINTNRELTTLLGEYDGKQITGLLNNQKVDLTLMRNIVSGPLDADKLDYFLRDSYFCGVKYGIFDIDRLLNVLCAIKDENEHNSYLGIHDDGIHTLEQYFLAKYYLTTQVYFHKIRRVTDAMIIRGIELAIDKYDIYQLKKIFSYSGDEKYLSSYLNTNDEQIFQIIAESGKKCIQSKEIFDRLLNRRLFKMIFTAEIKGIPFKKELDKERVQKINKPENSVFKARLEEGLAKVLKCPKELVIVQSSQIKSVKEMAKDSESEILVLNDDGTRPSRFSEKSTVFQAIDEKLKDIMVDVYAPIEYQNKNEKYQMISKYKQPVIDILTGE